MLHRPVESGQYTSIAFTTRLVEAGIDPSAGSVGDALDNALAESTVGSFKNELIRRQGPWRDVDHVELATAEWVQWFNSDPTSTSTTSPPKPPSNSTTLTETPCRKPGDSTNRVSGHAGTAQGQL